jgi:hypothetical protein
MLYDEHNIFNLQNTIRNNKKKPNQNIDSAFKIKYKI